MAMTAEEVTGVGVLVVDDIQLYQDYLISVLEREPFIVDVAGVPDGEAALRVLGQRGFQVVLVNLATANSLALCKELVASACGARVVALAVSGSDHEILACAEAGVSGYLLRDQSLADLVGKLLNGPALVFGRGPVGGVARPQVPLLRVLAGPPRQQLRIALLFLLDRPVELRREVIDQSIPDLEKRLAAPSPGMRPKSIREAATRVPTLLAQ